MTDPRMVSVKVILQECFWGEYNLSAQDILDRLDRNEPEFNRFLFSKIIENSRHPSRHIRNLFPPTILEDLLERYREQAGEEKLIRLIAANLTGNHNQTP